MRISWGPSRALRPVNRGLANELIPNVLDTKQTGELNVGTVSRAGLAETRMQTRTRGRVCLCLRGEMEGR